jgi:hypothetical protein
MADEKLAELELHSREPQQRPHLARRSQEMALERGRAPRRARELEPVQLDLGIDL